MLKNVFSALHFVYPFLSSAALPDTGPTPLQGESLAAPSANAPGPSREGEIPSEQPGHAAPHSASLSQRDMYWPEFRTLQHEFATIVSKLSKVLSALTPAEFDSLLVYLRERLKPTVNGCLPTGQPADLPKGTVSPSALLQHLQNRWDYLNTDLIEDIIQLICEGILQHVSITASSLQSLMTKYKENVCSKVTRTLKECKRKKVKLSAPPNYTTMAVEMNPGGSPLSVHLRQILDLKDVLVRRFGVCGALFAGWSEGSIVLYFFIPEEAVYSLCPKLESDCASLQRLHVTTVVVFGHFSVDVGYQQMSLLHKVGVACCSSTWEVCELGGVASRRWCVRNRATDQKWRSADCISCISVCSLLSGTVSVHCCSGCVGEQDYRSHVSSLFIPAAELCAVTCCPCATGSEYRCWSRLQAVCEFEEFLVCLCFPCRVWCPGSSPWRRRWCSSDRQWSSNKK